MGCVTAFLRSNDSRRAGIKVKPMRKKCTFLPSKAMDRSRESAGTVVKCAVTRPWTVRNVKGGRTNGNNEGNTGSNKMCNFCGLKGHKETGCFKKFP
jgi:hypothetical protein